MRPIIVGIDPGTTLGYAIVDFEGSLLRIDSSRSHSMSQLTEQVISVGKPVIVAGDKKKIPGVVQSFASSTGAKAYSPGRDLLIREKREIVSGFDFGKDHERDALAAALIALKNHSELLKKIDAFARRNKKPYKDRLIEMVIRNDGMSISLASDMIEKPESEPVRIVRKVIEKEGMKPEISKLHSALKKKEREQDLLSKQVQDLKKKNKELTRRYDELSRRSGSLLTEERSKDIRQFRQERIRSISKKLRKKEERIRSLQKELEKQESFIAKGGLIAKRLENLGWKEFRLKEKKLNIVEGDILYVRSLDEFSEKVLGKLKGKITTIIFDGDDNPAIGKRQDFLLLSSEGLIREHSRSFARVDSGALEKAKRKSDILGRVLSQYRKERSGKE